MLSVYLSQYYVNVVVKCGALSVFVPFSTPFTLMIFIDIFIHENFNCQTRGLAYRGIFLVFAVVTSVRIMEQMRYVFPDLRNILISCVNHNDPIEFEA